MAEQHPPRPSESPRGVLGAVSCAQVLHISPITSPPLDTGGDIKYRASILTLDSHI